MALASLLVAGRHWAQDLAANPSLPLAMQQAVAEQPGAVDVPVKAGDLVIGDSRLYHSAYENRSDERRTCVTMWWLNWDRCGVQFRRHSSHGPLPPPGSSTGPCRIPVQYVFEASLGSLIPTFQVLMSHLLSVMWLLFRTRC